MSFGHGGLDDELMICSRRCHRLPHLQRRWATQSFALRAGMIRGDRNQGMNPLATIARPPGEGGLGNLSASFKRRRVRKRSHALRAEAIVFRSSLGQHTDGAQRPWGCTLMVAAGASTGPTRLDRSHHIESGRYSPAGRTNVAGGFNRRLVVNGKSHPEGERVFLSAAQEHSTVTVRERAESRLIPRILADSS